MSEVLTSIIGLISEAKLMPDADIPWLLELETQVVQKARAPFESAMSGGGGGMDPNLGGPGAPGGPMPGDPMAGAGPMPGGGGGDIAALLGLAPPGPSTPPTTVGPPPPGMSAGMPAPMTGMRGGGGSTNLGEVQRLMGAGPPRGGRG